MPCNACTNPAAPDDDYCPECRAAIGSFRRAIDAACTACGRTAEIDALCRDCFDEICAGIVAADGTLPPSERGGGGW